MLITGKGNLSDKLKIAVSYCQPLSKAEFHTEEEKKLFQEMTEIWAEYKIFWNEGKMLSYAPWQVKKRMAKLIFDLFTLVACESEFYDQHKK